jgi:hypothetical protein
VEGKVMYDRFKKIDYKGKEIIIVDYSNLRKEAYVEAILKVRECFTEIINNGTHNILSLVNTTNSYVNNEALEEIKKLSAYINPYIKKLAYVGITGMKKLFIRILNVFTKDIEQKLFDTMDEAKEWLVKED